MIPSSWGVLWHPSSLAHEYLFPPLSILSGISRYHQMVRSASPQSQSGVRTHEPSAIVNLVECWFSSNTGTNIVALAYILFCHRLTVVCTRSTQACCGTSSHIINSRQHSCIQGCGIVITFFNLGKLAVFCRTRSTI